MTRLIFSLCLLLLFDTVYASNKVTVPERLFKMAGAEVNVTNGDLLYKSQAAGYYTGGGGVVVRSPIKNAQFISVHSPDIQAGCGGIDIYTGGFSFISSDQLVNTLQAISSNAKSFAFLLGLESVSPMATNTMRQLQSWANTINEIGINSCETAASLVGSVWPANEMASQHVCRTVNASNPFYNDFIAARHGCAGKEGKEKSQNVKLTLQGDYNIAWEALMCQPFFKNRENKELAEMYMTLVGTFIVKANGYPNFYFSKAQDNSFLNNLLEGGKLKKYYCEDREKCLVIQEKEIDLLNSDSWFTRIRKTLINIQEKAIADTPLDEQEKALLQMSRLPLFKIINVLSAYHRGKSCTMELDNLADIISWDILAQIINEAIQTIRIGCMQLRETCMYSTKIDQYMEDLERTKKVVKRYEEHAKKGMDLEMRLIQKMQLLEKQINSEIMVN